MEEVKRKIGVVVEEVMDAFQRDDGFMTSSCECRKKGEKLRMEGEEKQAGVFLEEELVLSIWYKNQEEGSSLIGPFEFEASG